MSLNRSELEPFLCEVDPARESVYARPFGELDLATVPVVEARLRELHEAGWKTIILDLRGVRFLDSSGLRMILEWDAMSRADGFSFGIVPGPPPVQRLFELTNLTGHLPFVAERHELTGKDQAWTPWPASGDIAKHGASPLRNPGRRRE